MKNPSLPDVMQMSFEQCRVSTRTYAKTFYFASHVLPREKRMAAYAVYAFCRYADELVDGAAAIAEPGTVLRELGLLRDQLVELYSQADAGETKQGAFRDTVRKYGIPVEYFLDLLRGVEMDLMKKRYRDFAELDEYCYCVASTVGLIMTKIFGSADEDGALQHAVELGKAMQLTNILRDVGEDYRRGRLYLPADELQRFGVKEEDLESGQVTPAFAELMTFQIRRARDLYACAEAGIPTLTDDGSRFCVRLMSRTYANILSAIEANGFDTLSRRAYVSLTRKFRIAVRSYLEQSSRDGHANVHVLRTTTPRIVQPHSRRSLHVR
jgi:phytoene synthase